MKKLFFIFTILTLSLIIFVRCEKEPSNDDENNNNDIISELDYGIIAQLKLEGRARSVYVVDTYIFIACGSSGGLQIVDINDTISPQLVGQIDTDGDALNVYVDGDYAYLADGQAGGIKIINISDKTNPTLTSSYSTGGKSLELKVIGNILYLADGATGIKLIDISNKEKPRLINSYLTIVPSNVTPPDVTNIFVDENYAYISSNGAVGVEIIDISDTSNIQLVSTFVPDNGHWTHELVVVDNYCYATSVAGLGIINVLDKTEPLMAANVHGENNTYSLYVQNDYLYLTDLGNPKLHQVDIAEKSSPTQIKNFPELSNPYDVFVINELAFVADFDEGLKIIRLEKY